jgi:sugar lactone lactonase YvrE
MGPIRVLCGVFAIVVTGMPLMAQTTEEMARAGEHVQQALQARQAGDVTTYLSSLREAEQLRPGHPELIYFIAGAQALNGDKAGAVLSLQRVADMGLGLQADSDPDFETLAGEPGFSEAIEQIQANRLPSGVSATAFVVPGEPDFVPEGFAHDPTDGSFYLGSVHKRKILRVDADGLVSEFAAPAFAGLMSVMGMTVDPEARILWVATAGMRETRGLSEDNLGRSAVYRFNLDTRNVDQSNHFSNRDEQRVLGDLVLAEDGDLYLSDARGSGIHRIRAGGDFLETFIQPGTFRSPQGLAMSEDERGFYVADYSTGISYVFRPTREVFRMPPPPGQTLLGIDGLVRDADALIAIQNGTMPHRILRLQLSPDGRAITGVRVLASNLPDWDEPTLGMMLGDRFYYVANSHWNRFVDGQLPTGADLTDPRIMWLDPR